MNVSVIVSQADKWKNGKPREVMAMSITFPVNNVQLTNTDELEKKDVEEFLKLANSEKIPVNIMSSLNSGTTMKSNSLETLPFTKAERVLTTVKDGRIGPVHDGKNFAAQHTFITPGADGKNETTKILYGNVEVVVVGQQNVEKVELDFMRTALKNTLFMYEDEDIPRIMSALLEKHSPNQDWQVVGVGGENNYVGSEKWARLRTLDQDYLIFTI